MAARERLPLAPGTRVSVKFNDSSRAGFSWYKGTVKGLKGPNRYRISYDEDDEVSSLDPADEEYRVLPAKRTRRTAEEEEEGAAVKPELAAAAAAVAVPMRRSTPKAPAAAAAKRTGRTKESPAAPVAVPPTTTVPAAAAAAPAARKPVKPEKPEKVARVAALLDRMPADKRAVAELGGWCDAKISAWLDRDRNANGYYYRFLPEGEEPKAGPWSKDELEKLKRICLERGINQLGSSPQWGMLSMEFPGRVGYACSSMYRRFVDRHEIIDPNFVFDANGKSRYQRGAPRMPVKPREPRRRSGDSAATRGARPPRPPSASASARQLRSRQRRRRDADGIHSGDVSDSEDEWDLPRKHFTDSRTVDWVTDAAQSNGVDNPLPNYIDQITGDVIRLPCISPEGYVAGRRAWVASLERRQGKCPFTNVKLSHRSLVLLTFDNIALHRDRIRNFDGDREVALSSVPFDPPSEDGAPDASAAAEDVSPPTAPAPPAPFPAAAYLPAP